MADDHQDQTLAQQQYPDLNPYSASNGTDHSAADQAKTAVNSKSSPSPSVPTNLPPSASPRRRPPNMPPSDAQQSTAQTIDNIKNSQTVQSFTNGPVAEKARIEAAATKNEFGNLAASRQTPDIQTATGQNLTHYHSFFYNLLSWENPRATALSYATIVLTVLVARYVPLAKYIFKASYMILGITAAAEISGKLVIGQGIATKLRPRKYYTIPQETLESVLSDAVELVNFFVIEFQRVVFAENVYATIAAFLSAFLSYFLVKITPAWGLFLLSTTVIYFAPLIYLTNKELIDEILGNAKNIVSQQASQVRGLAAQHTEKAWEASQSAFKEYSAKASGAIGQTTAKAQQSIGQAKKSAVDKGLVSDDTASKILPNQSTNDSAANEFAPSETTTENVTSETAPVTSETAPVDDESFPSAPKEEPTVPVNVSDPVADKTVEAEPIPA